MFKRMFSRKKQEGAAAAAAAAAGEEADHGFSFLKKSKCALTIYPSTLVAVEMDLLLGSAP